MNNDKYWHNLKLILRFNVPIFIQHILKRGGLTESEWRWLCREDENIDCLAGVLARADELLLYPKDEQVFKESLFVLVKAIAILSFVPGGIIFAGLRFSPEVENFVTEET